MMNSKRIDNVCLIVSACIAPNRNVPYLNIKEEAIRRKQYLDSLQFFIEKTNIKNIVFCDNSMTQVDEEIIIRAQKNHKDFEWLKFKGDEQIAIACGKGYGEGEIIEYILKNSEIVKNCSYLIKVTGRMIIENFNILFAFIKLDKIYMHPLTIIDGKIATVTKLYCMPKNVYEKYFIKAYKNVSDFQHNYLENVFSDIIINQNLDIHPFIVAPIYRGYSGTTGKVIHDNSIVDSIIKTVKMYYRYIKMKLGKYEVF